MCQQSICICARLEGPRLATGESTAGTFCEKKSPIHKPTKFNYNLWHWACQTKSGQKTGVTSYCNSSSQGLQMPAQQVPQEMWAIYSASLLSLCVLYASFRFSELSRISCRTHVWVLRCCVQTANAFKWRSCVRRSANAWIVRTIWPFWPRMY